MRWNSDRPLRSHHVFARITAEEKELCLRAAEVEERDFSDWVRRTLTRHAREIIERRTPGKAD